MTALERRRMRDVVGVIVGADRELFDRATATDWAAFERELDGPAVAFFMADLEALESPSGSYSPVPGKGE